jgi:hypothetical protein
MAEDDTAISEVIKNEEETTASLSPKESLSGRSASWPKQEHRSVEQDDDVVVVVKGTQQNRTTADHVKLQQCIVAKKEDIPQHDKESSLTSTHPPPTNKAEDNQKHNNDDQDDDDDDDDDPMEKAVVLDDNDPPSSQTPSKTKPLSVESVHEDVHDDDDDHDENTKEHEKIDSKYKTALKDKKGRKAVVKAIKSDENQERPKGDEETERIIECPMVQDVLVGMGHALKAHPGNQRMVAIIAVHRDRYEAADKDGKRKLVKEVTSEVLRGNTRFLKVNESGTGWVRCRSKEIREKGTLRKL